MSSSPTFILRSPVCLLLFADVFHTTSSHLIINNINFLSIFIDANNLHPHYLWSSLIIFIFHHNQGGNSEYKRQVHSNLSAARLRTLSSQIFYRLDKGCGRCTHHAGV